MKKQYTLVELLVTIAIIAILAGILIPSTGYAMKRARITQARADISHLMTAIKSFENTYRLLPVDVTTSSATPDTGTTWRKYYDNNNYSDESKPDSQTYDVFVQVLANMDVTTPAIHPFSPANVKRYYVDPSYKNKKAGDSSMSMIKKLKNPRNIRFLDVNSAEFEKKGFIDPWGNRYAITFNSSYNPNGVITPDGRTRIGSVFIYSFGPNRIDDDGKNTANSDEKNAKKRAKQDDICSWDAL